MYSSPPVNVEKYIHRLNRSKHFTMDDFLSSKSIPKILPYSESQKEKFIENEKKLRKGEHFTFQMLEHYQQWLQFTLTFQKLEEEKNIFIILRALPKDVSEQELPKWIELRNKIAYRQLVRLKNKLRENGPKYYYYIVSQTKHDNEQMVFENESINLHMIQPDDYQRLFHFIEYYDRGNEYFSSQWTLRWRFDPPRQDQYDSFDEFYLKRVRNWDQKDPRYKRNLEVRLLFARYAGFIHVMLAKKFQPKALLNMDYCMAASLLKSYCGDTPLQYQTPFFKGIRFYKEYLENFYFQVDVYTSYKTTNENGMVEQRNSFFQNYIKLVQKKKKILSVQSQSDDVVQIVTDQIEEKWITSSREIKPTSSYLRPELQWIIDSIPTDLTQIQWEGMQEMNKYLPKLQNFEENYISKTPNLYLPNIMPAIDFAEYYGDVQEKPKEKREQLHQDDVEDEQQQQEKQQEKQKKNIKVQKYQQIKQLISHQPVRYNEGGRTYFQCHCGSRLAKLYSPHTCKNKSHSVDPSLTLMDGFIEFYRATKSRHYGLCLHCDNVMSMDKKIKESHQCDNNFQYSVLDYPLDIQNISLYTGIFLTNICRVQVRHSYQIPFKTVYQQHLQLPENVFKKSRSPDIHPYFSYGNRTIVLAPQIKGMTCPGIQKGTVFGPVGGNIVHSYVRLSQNWSRIHINQEYDWVPLCHYTLASLQIVTDGIVDRQPNITLVFGVYENKIYAFWKAIRNIPLDGKLVADHRVNPQ